MSIDWTNRTAKVSKNFTVGDLIYLPSWKRLANAEDGLDETIQTNLMLLVSRLESIRAFFNAPIIVHVSYRPDLYNQLVKGKRHSAHLLGLASDFHVVGISCDDARKQILDAHLLDALNIRMEDQVGSNWIHIDLQPPKPNRFFKP